MNPRILIFTCLLLVSKIAQNEAQKQIIIIGLDKDKEQDNLLDLEKLENEDVRNVLKFSGYEERNNYRYSERDNSYENINDKILGDTDDESLEDGNLLRKNLRNILARLLRDGQLSTNNAGALPQSDKSLETDILTLKDLKCYGRSGHGKSCSKKIVKLCQKACKSAINAGCSGRSCKGRLKSKMKHDCKSVCKSRYDTSSAKSFRC